MLALTAMSSFSDAHETPDIPLIAANLNCLVGARQKQIWAVLRCDDSLQRLSYSLAATFLGRMCLSGDVAELESPAWQLVGGAISFYREVAPIIRDGTFRCIREGGESYQHPTGHQLVTIHAPTQRRLLIVWHRFAGGGAHLETELPAGVPWRLTRTLSHTDCGASLTGRRIQWTCSEAWVGGVFLLEAG